MPETEVEPLKPPLPLDDTSGVSDRIKAQADIKKRAKEVPEDKALSEMRQKDSLKLKPEAFSKAVANSVVYKHQDQIEAGDGNKLQQIGINPQIVGSQLNIYGSGLRNDASEVDFEKLYKNQTEAVEKVPAKSFQELPFTTVPKLQVSNQKALDALVDRIPADLFVQIDDRQRFMGYLSHSSIFKNHNPDEILKVLQSTSSIEDIDPYQSILCTLKGKHNTVYHTRDQVEKDTDYDHRDRNLQHCISELEQSKPRQLDRKIIVDELGKLASQLGNSYRDHFVMLEQNIIQQRQQKLQELMDGIEFSKKMRQIAEVRATNVEKAQISLQKASSQQIIYEDEMRTGHTDDMEFLEEFFEEQLKQETETTDQQKIQFFLQYTDQMSTKAFRQEGEQLRYTKGQTLDEDLIDLGITIEAMQNVEPLQNLALAEFLSSEMPTVDTEQSAKLRTSFLQLKTPVSEQIAVFDSLVDKVGEQAGDLYERFASGLPGSSEEISRVLGITPKTE